jgi:hypothetical protein
MKMNWTHSSKVVVLAVLLAVSLGAAGTATAFSFDDSGVDDEMEVGQQETATVVMEEPFAERNPGWTLVVDSEFEDAGVTLTAETPTETIQESGEGEASITLDNEAIDQVEIEVTGTVPEVGQYSYENPEQEEFVAVRASDDSGVIEEWGVHRYTEGSREARERIDEASEYANEDDDDFQSAVDLYNSGSFEQATTEADSIISDAESSEQTQTMLFVGAGVVVLLILLGGGYYVYSQRSQNTNKLQ